MDNTVKVWPCGCVETDNGNGMTVTVHGTSWCAKNPKACDELKDFWGGKVPDFEVKLAAMYDDAI